MIKQRYVEFEKKYILEDAVFNPYELTATGLSKLQKTITLNIVAFIAFVPLAALSIRAIYRMAYEGVKSIAQSEISEQLLSVLIANVPILILFLITSWGFNKSLSYITETGLWARVSVSDELQDEWEISQKQKSCTAAYTIFGYAFIGLFLLGLVYCGVHYLVVERLPNPPSFGVWVMLGLIGIWAYSLLPITYLAWTLAPVDEDDLDDPIVKPEPKNKTPISPKQKWIKHGTTLVIYAVFSAVGYFWATSR